MGFYKAYPTRDTFIGNGNTKLNFGDDHITDMFITSNSTSAVFTRALFQFNITSAQLTSLTSTYNATLSIFNCRNFLFTDEQYYLELYAITQDWSEGSGILLNPTIAATNWVDRKQGINWSTSGGSYSSSPSASIYFDAGTENLTANVSAFIEYWKTSPNYGLMVKFPALVESSTSNYQNNKSFYARNTSTVFKPCIDITYDDVLIKDDVANLRLGVNNLYIYDNNVNTSAYPGGAYIKYDSMSISAFQYPMTFVRSHIWTISFTASAINYDELLLVYSNTAAGYSVTSTVTGSSVATSFVTNNSNYIQANMLMLPEYRNDEIPTLWAKVYQHINWRMGSVAVRYFTSGGVYLYFIEKNTRLQYSPEQEMNYDANGYFLKYDMNTLVNGYWYIPVLKIMDNGETVYREIPEAEFYVRKVK